MLYLSESVTPPYIGTGNASTGITIAYGMCVTSPNMIMKIDFFAQGLSPPCSYIRVVPDPAAVPPGVLVADCSFPLPILQIATGGAMVVNPDPSCMCSIPVEETTWGQVKALYQ
jgi:hypothetical protein